jgi:hypothetical protein
MRRGGALKQDEIRLNWDHGSVPMICPDVSNVFVKSANIMTAVAGTFAWGCFRFFCCPVYAKKGHVREDGRLVHDMLFAQVKTPAESRGPWDYYKILGVIPGDRAFRPLAEGGCPLVAH